MTRVEQRLRAAIEAIGEGFALFDEQEKLVLCNETYARPYDRAPGELIGRSMAQMAADYASANLPESEREADVERRLARLRDGDASPLEARTRDGRWLLVTQRRTEDGETVVVRADITELKRRERELAAARDRLQRQTRRLARLTEQHKSARDSAEAANRAKSEFLAHMSHELRTPLTTIIGFAEVMREEALGPLGSAKYREYSEHIHASGQHLLALLDEILALAKLDAVQLSLEESEFEAAALVERVVAMMGERAAAKGVELSAIASALPILRGDARRLLQVLLNLISNAIKFTPSGGHVELTGGIDAKGAAFLVVRDTGIGIPEKQMPFLFEPLARLRDALATGEPGIRLGLAIVRKYVELHGGEIAVASEPGQGTSVTIRLPATRVVDGRKRRRAR